MISRFFIDRPVFATVLSVVITLIGGIALCFLPVAQYPRITPPGVTISISYPGASAQVVADTVAAPIEQAVNGVEGMLYMSSQSGNDGTYSLTVTFDVGTDMNAAVVKVQNRVALAMPLLPTEVQNQGITIRKRTPDILMIVNLYSPDRRYDDIYLSNYATIHVRDELLRVAGVSDVTYQGERDYSIRVWLDPQKMAACSVTAMDVANAVRSQNLDAPAGRIGQPPTSPGQAFDWPLDTLGRLSNPEQFDEIIVKVALGVPPAAATLTAPAVLPDGSGLPNPASPSGTTAGTADNSAAADGTQTDATAGDVTTFAAPAGSTTTGSATNTAAAAAGGVTSSGAATPGAATTGATAGGTTTGGGAAGGTGTLGGGASTGGGATAGGGGSTGGGGTTGGGASGGGLLGGAVTGPRVAPARPAPGIVRIRDVARVELGAQNYNQSCLFDGQPAVGLSVYQLPGTNALDVADAVRKKMDELAARFPDGVAYDVGYDTVPFVRESIADVVQTMFAAVALVGLVVLIFLQDWKAMVLPMIDVPVSIIGTFAVMAVVGFSLNNISLFGLVVTIGIVVDDAIVVLENIERMLAKGYDVRTATIKAMQEVTGPIAAVALVLCAVFVPCAFIGGITGQFFRQFAVTISVSTLISAVNAITMTPSRAVLLFKTEVGGQGHEHRREALPWWIFGVVGGFAAAWLGGKMLRAAGFAGAEAAGLSALFRPQTVALFTLGALAGGTAGWFAIRPVNAVLGRLLRGFNRAFEQISAAFGWVVGGLLRASAIVLLLYGGLLALTCWVFQNAPTGFIPEQDQGRLIASIQLPDSASLERTQQVATRVAEIVRDTPGIAHSVAMVGLSFLLQANSPNLASMFIVLDPFDKRQKPELSATGIMARLRRQWAREIKDAVVLVNGASAIPGLGTAGGFKFIVEDRGDLGLRALQRQTDDLVRKLQADLPGLNSVATQFRSNVPQLFLEIDRTKAATLGVPLADVNQTLDVFMGSLYVNSFNEFGRHWQVTLQAQGVYRNRVGDLNLLEVRNALGQMVLLGTLVRPREIGGPIAVPRYNLYTSASVNGNIATGYSTGDVIREIEQKAGETLPLSMKTDWTELMFMQKRAGNTAFYVFLLSVLSVFLALSALYESWWLPAAVILVVPLCLLCSVAGVRAMGRDVNIFVQIGLVVLVALACKNAILVVEYAKQLHREGQARFAATKQASRLRLRPILMTSLAFIFGVIPLMVASGAGAEMRRSLGIAVFNGMLGVTLFGVFLTPVFFYVITGLSESRLFASAAARWLLSSALGGLAGLAGGFWLGKLGVVLLPWAAIIGAGAGVMIVLSILEIQRRMRPRP
jgi:multidrug efflux pump